MKQIPLTQGQFALVDDEDYDWLMQWKWHAFQGPTNKTYYAAKRIYGDFAYLNSAAKEEK